MMASVKRRALNRPFAGRFIFNLGLEPDQIKSINYQAFVTAAVLPLHETIRTIVKQR